METYILTLLAYGAFTFGAMYVTTKCNTMKTKEKGLSYYLIVLGAVALLIKFIISI